MCKMSDEEAMCSIVQDECPIQRILVVEKNSSMNQYLFTWKFLVHAIVNDEAPVTDWNAYLFRMTQDPGLWPGGYGTLSTKLLTESHYSSIVKEHLLLMWKGGKVTSQFRVEPLTQYQ